MYNFFAILFEVNSGSSDRNYQLFAPVLRTTADIGVSLPTPRASAMLIGALLIALVASSARADDDTTTTTTAGPVFIREPSNRVDFSNTTGAIVECKAKGNPQPDIIWVRSDGTAVGDVPGLRRVLANGNLVFPPFRAEDYRQEVHAQVYACLAKNTEGSIHSRDVNVRAVVQQFYQTEVNNEYVIRGNAAVLKCSIPSFVADFVVVVSWSDSDGHQYGMNEDNYVVTQYYEAEVVSEYVIRGNTAVLKCNIPSFVADFVRVDSWVGSDGSLYNYDANYVVNQFYKAEILTEYVIRGNTAVLKCSIPSFVADFVHVESWIDDQGNVMKVSDDYVVSQYYVTEAENEYVIRGNSAVMKCKIPSFVADFVQIDSWIASDGQVHKYDDNSDYVVAQTYEIEADNEYVIRGNAAVMKCEVPSFVSDFVVVENWRDSQGNVYLPGSDDYVVQQFYQSRVIDEFVLKGNTGILKCLVPSFVTDFVQIESWVADDGTAYKYHDGLDYVVNQYYEAQVYDVFVIKGNTAVFKCQIPSFVSDHVEILSWQDTASNKFLPPTDDYVVSQSYTANVMDESVLKGNTAIFKCHIPSFVSDFVYVTSWLQNDGHEILTQDGLYDSKYLVLPSGELHIKDVGPEDGYKSYQCRTKHRLTGETRLSATKGRLVITEPVASVIPKFPTIDSSRSFKGTVTSSITLLCPALAYPVPKFSSRFSGAIIQVNSFALLEPVESRPPKLLADSKLKYIERDAASSIPMFCPAQGYPVPMFRYVASRNNLDSLFIEPVGLKAPTFSSLSKSFSYETRQKHGFVLLCPAQALPIPKFRLPPKSKLDAVTGEANEDLVLPCDAQATPIPKFRKGSRKEFGTALSCSGFTSAVFQVRYTFFTHIQVFMAFNIANILMIKQNQLDPKHRHFHPTQKHPHSLDRKDKVSLYCAKLKEPLGSKPPTFSSDSKGFIFVKEAGKSLALLCPAQSLPLPLFRTHSGCKSKSEGYGYC
ncbi:hypothetical protein JTB14_005124 [Gonioctena quinquepunctata]|nr:hypothetical protein JTB14_005124 [Gonioctena quinquepunctata]